MNQLLHTAQRQTQDQPKHQHEPELPQHILLLHLYQLHLNQARQLIPPLTIRPSWQYTALGKLNYTPDRLKPDPQSQQAQLSSAISTYRRHISIAIACLQSLITLASHPSSPAASPVPTEIDIYARCQLAQVLISETNEYQLATQIIQHALKLSRQRDAFTPFKLSLSESLIAIQVADPTVSFRQIKKQIERCIQLTLKNQTVDPRYISWYYRFQLLLCHMAYQRAKDLPTALAALRNILSLAESRNDAELWIACKTHEIKLAMDRHEWGLVGQLFSSVMGMIELPDLPSQASPPSPHPQHIPQAVPQPPRHVVPIGRQLKNYIMLLLIIYYSIIGQIESAKWWLKHLRNEMDSPKREEGDAEGTYKVINAEHAPQDHASRMLYITHQAHPRQLLNHFAEKNHTIRYDLYHAQRSHVHGHLSRQSCRPFRWTWKITQIIDIRPGRLETSGSAAYPRFPIPCKPLSAYRTRTSGLLPTEINLMASQIAIVRSDFHYADQLLVEAIKITHQEARWEVYSPRVSFLKSMLSHATGNLPSARQSLLTTLFLVDSHVNTLAKACYVLLELAESDERLIAPKHHRVDQHLLSPPAIPRSLAIDRLINELALLAKVSLPNVSMAIHVVLAVSCGEIVKAKHHLTTALNEANKTSNTHLKMILLGLLSTMFLNTRSDQATKMLKSCYKLSQGFSSDHHHLQHTPLQSRTSLENFQPADVVVGNSSLGLCVGRKLVEIYETQSSMGNENREEGNVEEADRMHNKLKKDRLILANLAHQRALDQTPLL
ncbi:hypothetical protein VP01_111g9 [Puccinia sorghi]|uniref:Uncharacterized protein n=1 Tax=Puccinia sorghi TaxID=27349 RepID=A0A0L6VSM8_9BASI|nr:hypothetical protein VP01_111g9 [Puccinia sorghi]